MRIGNEPSYLLCINNEPTLNVSITAFITVDNSFKQSSGIYYGTKGIGAYAEVTSDVMSEGIHLLGCAMALEGTDNFHTTHHPMLYVCKLFDVGHLLTCVVGRTLERNVVNK